jgi:hypothetical protein
MSLHFGVSRVHRRHASVACAIGAAAGLLSYAFLNRPGSGGDFFFFWHAGRSLMAGDNPYKVIPVGPENPGGDVFLYPLPALLVIVPFVWLPLAASGAAFIGVSTALLAYLIVRDSPHKLPMFMGAPFLMAVSLGQWSPLITAAALSGNLGFVFTAKPHLGLPAWIYRPTIRSIVSGALLVLVSFAIQPTWPVDWYRNISHRPEKLSPLLTLAGPVLLLAAIRWRRPEARLLLAMACVPQTLFFYDQLILWLIPRTLRQSLILSLASFALLLTWFYRLGPGEYYMQKAIPYAMGIYFVALATVLLPEPKPAPESTESQTTDPIGAVAAP